MGKTLVIAEKPSVAKAIAEAIGVSGRKESWYESDQVIVTNAFGHLVELHVPEAETTEWDLAKLPIIPEKFSLKPISQSASQFRIVKQLMERDDVSVVVNACDAGREGEAIFRLTYELARCRKTMQRMWLRTMTREGIVSAWRDLKPGAEFDNLGAAARCRAEADWLIGINLTRGLSRLNQDVSGVRDVLTAGRVQTPTLALLVDRELAIENFVPKDYWELHATLGAARGQWVARWKRDSRGEPGDGDGFRINQREAAEALLARVQNVPPSSVVDESKPRVESAPPLFDLTTLQREANKAFRFSAKKTLDIAQALYETHKATTYPRTDAQALPEDYVDEAKKVLAAISQPEYTQHAARVLENGWCVQSHPVFDNSKISDHFAIVPTGVRVHGLNDDEARIYDLVVKRFIAVFHPPAKYQVTTRTAIITGEKFIASGKVMLEPGWRQVFGADAQKDEEVDDKHVSNLPSLTPGEPVENRRVDLVALKTSPPSRYTEATLLGAMETAGKQVEDAQLAEAMRERGLGTPATRAAIIEGLLSVGNPTKPREPYVRREGKLAHLVPSGKGISMVLFARRNGQAALTSAEMTGDWEFKLREIEQGHISARDFMRGIADQARSMISALQGVAASSTPVAAISSGPSGKKFDCACPKCGGEMVLTDRGATCVSSACKFILWRDQFKHSLTLTEMKALLTKGVIPPVEMVSPKSGLKFTAGLRLNREEWKTELVFEDRADRQPPSPVVPVDGVACPKCRSPLMGNDRGWRCAAGCGFLLGRVIASRVMSEPEMASLCKTGRLPLMKGFVSKAMKSFEAGLALDPKDNFKATFEFPERAR